MRATDDPICAVPCREVREVRAQFDAFRTETVRRLAEGDVTLATISTKLNWLIGILSGIGAAVLAAVLRILAA